MTSFFCSSTNSKFYPILWFSVAVSWDWINNLPRSIHGFAYRHNMIPVCWLWTYQTGGNYQDVSSENSYQSNFWFSNLPWLGVGYWALNVIRYIIIYIYFISCPVNYVRRRTVYSLNRIWKTRALLIAAKRDPDKKVGNGANHLYGSS